MKYTKQLPTVPGYYVVRYVNEEKPLRVVDLKYDGENLRAYYEIDSNVPMDIENCSPFGEIGPLEAFEWLSLNDDDSKTVEGLNKDISNMEKAMQKAWDEQKFYHLAQWIQPGSGE